MPFTVPRLRPTPRAAVAAALAAALPWSAFALSPEQVRNSLVESLPNLSAGRISAPGYFHLGEESAGLGYNSRLKKWGAKVERYTTLNPSLRVDYGLQLTSRLGAGGTLTHQSDYSEMVLNGIYAPKRNLRFQLAGAQLRAPEGALAAAPSDNFLQNSYLFGAKKFWDKYEHLADIGVSAYSLGANAPASVHAPFPAADDPFEAGQSALGRGRLDGYQLNLSLRPTPLSKLELRREASHLTYYFDTGSRREAPVVANRIRYTRELGNCLRLQGGYSTSTDADRVDIKLAKNNWNIRLSHEVADSSSSAVHLGYAIPLGKSASSRNPCGTRASGAPAFESVAEAAKQRPQQFPRAPLVSFGAR